MRPMGLSAQAIAGGGLDHPWDPGDLLRCVRYCESVGLSTAKLRERMAGRSEAWDRLLPEWDRLVTLLRHEMDTRTDDTAPLTFTEMHVILRGGVKCAPCAGSGHGEPCAKCRGTGRRNGGRCRADSCQRGMCSCASCGGRGYTTETTRQGHLVGSAR